MSKVEQRCKNTTRHISSKVLMLRRAKKMTQEQFAELVSLDRRTIARAEDGVHRPSPETLELIAYALKVPISYFYDDTVYRFDIKKSALIYEINTKLNTLPKTKLQKILNLINII